MRSGDDEIKEKLLKVYDENTLNERSEGMLLKILKEKLGVDIEMI